MAKPKNYKPEIFFLKIPGLISLTTYPKPPAAGPRYPPSGPPKVPASLPSLPYNPDHPTGYGTRPGLLSNHTVPLPSRYGIWTAYTARHIPWFHRPAAGYARAWPRNIHSKYYPCVPPDSYPL